VKTLTIALLLAVSSPAATTVLRIACGSSTPVQDTQGNFWAADTGFTGGAAWTAVNQATMGSLAAPYQTLRYSNPPSTPIVYSFAVPSGNYTVTLRFLEPNKTAAGQRAFNVKLQDSAVARLDPFAAAGGAMKSSETSYPVTVTNGQINLRLEAVLGNAIISAIQVDTVDQAPAVTASREFNCELGRGDAFGGSLTPGVFHMIGCENMGATPVRLLRVRCRADNDGGTLDVMVTGPNGLQSLLPAAIPCTADGTTQAPIADAEYPAGEILHWMVRVNEGAPPHFILATVTLETTPSPAIAKLVSLEACEGSGKSPEGFAWDCGGFYRSVLRLGDGTLLPLIAIVYDSSTMPSSTTAKWLPK
jgi:hypothetical protein